MSYSNLVGAAKHYNQVGKHAEVANASPHRLIQMLMEGALEKIAIAKGHMTQGSVEQKAHHIRWACAIIGGLQDALDVEQGGEVAENLDALYEYMQRQLTKANLHNDPALLDEVTNLMGTIKSGWDAIPEEYKNPQPVSEDMTAEAGK